MFFVLIGLYFGVPALLFLWARWLRRATSAPSSVSRRVYALLGVGTALMALIPVAWGVFGVLCILSMDSRANAPGPSAHPLLELLEDVAIGISGGAVLVIALSFAWLLYATWRWRWSSRAVEVPHEGPYR